MSDLVQKIRELLEKIDRTKHRLMSEDTRTDVWQEFTDDAPDLLSEAADRIEEMDRFIKMLLVYPNIKETIGLDMYDWAEHVVRREPEKETP